MTVTQVLNFQAFDDRGLLPGLVGADPVAGTCPGGSVVVGGRADAWRCTGGGKVLDPCFSREGGSELACVPDPFTRDVQIVRVSGVLSRGNRNDPGHIPWFLELMDATRCGPPPPGSTTTVGDRRLTYACAGGAEVYGDPDGTRPVWTVQLRPGADPAGLRTAGVKVAWY